MRRETNHPDGRDEPYRSDPPIVIDLTDPDGATHRDRLDRCRPDQHGSTIGESQSEPAIPVRYRKDHTVELPGRMAKVYSTVRTPHWYASPTMAKAKRRKLRARRSKANHGRKPNAGRG